MESKKFENVAICETNDKYEKCIIRNDDIYKRSNDIRSEFNRDYNRILHSNAYSIKLKYSLLLRMIIYVLGLSMLIMFLLLVTLLQSISV